MDEPIEVVHNDEYPNLCAPHGHPLSADEASPGIFVRTIEVQWHYSAPTDHDADKLGLQGRLEGITCIDFNATARRFLTAGGDSTIRIWEFHDESIASWLRNAAASDMSKCCSWIATLSCQDMPRCARWSPSGLIIASAHSDPRIRLWWKTDSDHSSGERSETWKDLRLLSGHLHDVMDVAFSPDSRHLISAGMQGSVLVHDLESIAPVVSLEAHSKFCHGVAWDPWNIYTATFGSGPGLLFHSIVPRSEVRRLQLVGQRQAKVHFHGEGCSSNMRRMSWSPDGSLLAVPYGKRSNDNDGNASEWKNCTYLFLRGQPEAPAATLSISSSNEIRGALWAPCFFTQVETERSNVVQDAGADEEPLHAAGSPEQWGPREYRMALAVWNEESVYVFTTNQHGRHSDFTDLHILSISDLTWSPDGRFILTCSLDGYVTALFYDRAIGRAFRLPTFAASPLCKGISTVRRKLADAGLEYELQRTKIHAKAHDSSAVQTAVVKKKKRRVEGGENIVTIAPPPAAAPQEDIALDELLACVGAEDQ